MAVVCHDAGGTEVISAYIKGRPDLYEYRVFAGGPAGEIFARKGIKIAQIFEEGQHWIANLFAGNRVNAVLTSIDWSSDLTARVRREAKKKGIYTIVYLDHWVYYRERLGYPQQGWEAALPDEFWAGDDYSLKLAKELFPSTKVRLEPNLYFEEVKEDFRRYLLENKKSLAANSLLFISEPISATNNVFGATAHPTTNEYSVLKNLLDALAETNFNKRVLIRFHPSEKPDKYNDLLVRYRGKLIIGKSFGKSIYGDLMVSSVVVGMESMALVIALLCGKKVMSLLPDCSLPFPEIEKVQSAKKLATMVA